jgi:hypothetical protein
MSERVLSTHETLLLESPSVMFTIEQINDLHAGLVSFLADGHSEYFGQRGQRVVSPPVHEVLPVAETSRPETFLPAPAPPRAKRDD